MNIQKMLFLSLVFIFIILPSPAIHSQENTGAEKTMLQEAQDLQKTQKTQIAGAGNMYNSIFGIYIFGGIGLPFGDILDAEHDSTTYTVTYTDGTTKTGKPDHTLYKFGAYGDVYIYSGESITTGIRIRYSRGIIEQEIGVGGGEYESKNFTETLMTYNSLAAGAILIWAPFRHPNIGFTGFLTGGRLFSSQITPMPILQAEDSSQYLLQKKKYDVDGYIIEAGIGAQYAFSAIILGGGVVYTHLIVKIKDNPYKPPYAPAVSDRSTLYAVSFELFAGVHF